MVRIVIIRIIRAKAIAKFYTSMGPLYTSLTEQKNSKQDELVIRLVFGDQYN